LLENYHLNRPIVAISNGINTSFFERDNLAGEEFREQFHYNKNDKIIMGVGLYLKRKGILDFVSLAKRMPEYKFIWFGYLDLKLVPKEISDAVNTKLDNLYFAGYVEPEVLKKAYSGCDLYLFPTLEETEGIPILEALVEKIPTLVRDIPVFSEYEENKVVYKAKNLDEFEVKIRDILNGKLPNLAENGYQEAIKKDVKIVGKELIDVYKSL
jgi:1,2-diacylglycerol-3-alpha-glucose alpha-1,2-glucosyltransferase